MSLRRARVGPLERMPLAEQYPAAAAATLATSLALPGLWLPFLSDDWAHLAAIERGAFVSTPFGYSRPLYAATFWLDSHVWGLSGSLFHLTNIVLMAAAAALVALLVERYSRDRSVAALAGLLFALHPAHVECAAWVAARADPLFSVLVLLAAIAWERWRENPRGAAWISILLFALALLAKETAAVLPVFLLLADLCRRDRRSGLSVTLRGLWPMFAVGMTYFLLVWPRAHGHSALALFGGALRKGPRGLLGSATAAVLPARTEAIEAHPFLWALVALGLTALLAGLALLHRRRIPAIAWASLAAFLVLLVPSLSSLQDRLLFLPSAASAVGLAALLRSAEPRARAAIGALLVITWSFFMAQRWDGWLDGGRTGRQLIAELTSESLTPGTQRLVVANMPHRVHGAPVFADFRAAVTLQGGRSIPIDSIALIDYPGGREDALAGPADDAIVRSSDAAEVVLRLAPGLLSGLVWPAPGRPPGPESASGVVLPETPDRIRVRLVHGDGRAAYYWSNGHLHRLFSPHPGLR